MTAIFLVWNRLGLAVAADSTLSLTRKLDDGTAATLATSQTSKIHKEIDKNFIVAWSGNNVINGIPVSGIVKRWSDRCSSQESLLDYVESFIKWFAEDSLLEFESDVAVLESTFTRQFNLIKKSLDKGEVGDRNTSEVVSWFYDYWENRFAPNIYGFSPKKNIPSESFEGNEAFFSTFANRFIEYRLPQETYSEYLSQVESAFTSAFTEVFGDSTWYKDESFAELKSRSVKFNIDHVFDSTHASIMFAGYGESDWLPNCVILKIYNYDTYLPWISLSTVTNPDHTWYENLAEFDTVLKFFAPIDSQVLNELRDSLKNKFRGRNYLDKVMDEIDSILGSHSSDLLDPMRNRLKFFDTDRLAFVASQMVALESLNSLIREDLPGVGGPIEVVQLTRSGFVENLNRES